MVWNGKERRKFPRAKFPCKIKVATTSKVLVSHTENIGEGGMRIVVEEDLGLSATVEVKLFLLRGGVAIKCKGKVMWIIERMNPLEGDALMYDTGIQFVGLSDVDKRYIRKFVETIILKEQKEQ